MSFWPFPTTLRAELEHACAAGPLVELGAGDGRLSRRLESLGLRPLRLDLRCPGGSGRRLDVVGDARRLPFADGRLGACVLGDVLRHLDTAGRVAVATACRRALAPGGVVIVLEDHPEARCSGEAHYRQALRLLTAFDDARGPAASLQSLTAPLCEHFGAAVAEGCEENAERVGDPLAPLRWMRVQMAVGRRVPESSVLAADLDVLESSVRRDGMLYGRYSWAAFRHEGEGRRGVDGASSPSDGSGAPTGTGARN